MEARKKASAHIVLKGGSGATEVSPHLAIEREQNRMCTAVLQGRPESCYSLELTLSS